MPASLLSQPDLQPPWTGPAESPPLHGQPDMLAKSAEDLGSLPGCEMLSPVWRFGRDARAGPGLTPALALASRPHLTTNDESLVSSGASRSGLALGLESGLSLKLPHGEEARPSR